MPAVFNSPITVIANDRTSMDHQLDEAVGAATEVPMEHGLQGILVTRHDHDSFTVELTDAVPYGSTHERKEW